MVERQKDPNDKAMFVIKLHFDPDDYELAEREAVRLDTYDHPNIVKYVDGFDNGEGKFAILMEYCSGKRHSFLFCLL